MTAGVPPRPNAQCPKCGSGERHRLLWLYLKNRTNLFSDKLRVLHFAPEYAFHKAFKSLPNLEYINTDLNSPLAMVKMDITDISIPDGTCDVILCSHVLEHVPDDKKALRELFRVLKKGGWAILQSPVNQNLSKTFEDLQVVSPEDRKISFGHEEHVRVYGRDYKKRLEEAGFSVRLDWYVRELGENLIYEYGLHPDEPVYYCAKP